MLEVSLEEIAVFASVSLQEATDALELVQKLEPAGVGARSMQESLWLQLERLGKHEELPGRLVQRHLAQLASHKFAEIAQREGVTLAEVRAALLVIRSLRPYPARGLFEGECQAVVPEVSIEKIGEGYVVIPRGELNPRLRVSSYYRTLVQSGAGLDRESRGYLSARLRGAAWFIRCIHQREVTIRKIAEVIARTQRHFLDFGFEALRPMVLRDVARELSLHESTISRAIAEKYLTTPQGIFEFKFFFTPRIKTARGEISTTTIRERLRNFIRTEDPQAPLSDQALAELLAQAEVRISRRTVTKYREALGIPPSALRKECAMNATEHGGV
ncbi:MAG: RNA polymerase sigma-54 factor [Proteobacteria bacterium]|nr:RNA polymerase sigma-54 factor [Pseudomonadota bacterium]